MIRGSNRVMLSALKQRLLGSDPYVGCLSNDEIDELAQL